MQKDTTVDKARRPGYARGSLLEGGALMRPDIQALADLVGRHYGLAAARIDALPGGLSALAYALIDRTGTRYFLKAYDLSRAGVSRWTEPIAQYIPALCAMAQSPALAGRVPQPVLTSSGAPCCGDGAFTCLLYRWIDGRAPSRASLTGAQLDALADIVAAVHAHPLPGGGPEALRERFDAPFAAGLERLLREAPGDLVPPAAGEKTRALLARLRGLAPRVRALGLPMGWTHGDIHRGNLMETDQGLMLIDWEGLSVAPPEADLFFLGRYEPGFSARYRARAGYAPHPEALAFFGARRRLDDIHEFLRALLIDRVGGEEGRAQRRYLAAELARLDPPMTFDFI